MTTAALTQSKEIGDLLLQVQDELKSLRTLIARDGQNVDVNLLQSNLKKAEDDIKQKSDFIINQLNSQVRMLPMIDDVGEEVGDEGQENVKASSYMSPLETLWDLAKRDRKAVAAITNGERGVKSGRNNQLATLETFSKNQRPATGNNEDDDQYRDYIIDEVQEIRKSNVVTQQHLSLSPGQQTRASRETRSLFNPENVLNRNALKENYNLQLPLIDKKEKLKTKMSTQIITGSTIEHLATLPLVYRRNPTLIPPPVNPSESRHGLLSLIERGLIPSSAKITFDQFPIASQNAEKLENADQDDKSLVAKFKTNELVYKLDPNYDPAKKVANNNKENAKPKKRPLSVKKVKSIEAANNSIISFNENNNPQRPPTTPLNTLQLELYDSSKFAHKFVIQNGQVKSDMFDFNSFKQSYILRWASILAIIKYLEDLCDNYSVPFGIVDGAKVAELSRCIDMDIKPDLEELIETFINENEVEKIVRTPGQRFKKQDGKQLAAIKIQSTWRRYRDRNAYLQYRRRKWAAGVIALTWVTYVKLSKAREQLKIARARHLENFRKRQKEFIKNWPRIRESRRVVIHLPSLGYSEHIRNSLRDLPIRENHQMARICDIIDSNVDVIYVSPIELNEETLQYYSKLFALRRAVESGNPKDLADVSSRYKIVIPEALNFFPSHQMALSTLLKYSPNALERIKNLIKGRDAYIVPGLLNADDLYIADYLNVPILGCDPELAALYSSKSGSKRIFQSAKVFTPYGEFDIYNKEQLYECLAQAIVENLIVQRWLFKLDDEFDGRGIAYCDIVKHLTCYNAALKEMVKFGDKWGKRWAYEPTYVKILEEIPDLLSRYAKPSNTNAYPNWDLYLKAFLARGGVLEAHPPSDSITSLTVSILIEPNGDTKILSSGDHIYANDRSTATYSCWGYTFPQTSVESRTLNETCTRIADACRHRHILGYVDVDFVTFIDPNTDKQVLWATDLNIFYSDNVASSSLLFYLSNGKFDPSEHSFEVAASVEASETAAAKANKKPRKKPTTIETTTNTRYAVMSSKLHHSNLSVIHYSVFFQTCRALGIGYDIKERQGTVFTLVDSLNHVNMGMITITDHLHTAMQQFAHNLLALHREISTENMQGRTNFLAAAQSIKKFLQSENNPDDETNKVT